MISFKRIPTQPGDCRTYRFRINGAVIFFAVWLLVWLLTS